MEENTGLPALPGPPSEEELPLMEESILLDLDFTGVSIDFEPLPVGTYPAVIEDVEYIPESKKSGQPMLKFTFKVTAEGHSGRKLFDNYSLQPDALWKVARTLEAIGYSVAGKKVGFDYRSVIGSPCHLVVGQDVYQGKLKNEVQEVLPPSESDLAGIGPAPF